MCCIQLLHRPSKNSTLVYEVPDSSQYLEAPKGIVHGLISESDECSEAYFSSGGDGIVKSESHHF